MRRYKGAIFKFVVTLPESYPEDAPKARFTSRVYHPLVTVKGDVDLSMRFPSWTPGQDYVILVLLFLKRMSAPG